MILSRKPHKNLDNRVAPRPGMTVLLAPYGAWDDLDVDDPCLVTRRADGRWAVISDRRGRNPLVRRNADELRALAAELELVVDDSRIYVP